MDSLHDRFLRLPNHERIGYLIGNFITNTMTIEERDELDEWVVQSDDNMKLFEDLTDDQYVKEFMSWNYTINTEQKLAMMKQRFKSWRLRTWYTYAAAASVILIVGWVVFRSNSDTKMTVAVSNIQVDMMPGGNYAQLKLPNGKLVGLRNDLDTTFNGIKIEHGEALYNEAEGDSSFHELLVPRKGTYKLVLSDGSIALLNSQSSIRYPSHFGAKAREVEVTGEIFFDVVHDVSRPFTVISSQGKIEDVGTKFNVDDFDHKLSVVEGAVRLATDERKIEMRRGDQWNGNKLASNVNMDPVIAWTNNQFHFRNLTIREIMPLLERWYDAKVIYRDDIDFHFNGKISRSVPLSHVLELLQGTEEVKFKMSNDTVIVMK